MALSCGLVGMSSCGKTVIFNAVTAAGASSYNSSGINRAVVPVPDPRLYRLADMYRPQKIVPTTLDIVDVPGVRAEAGGNGNGFRMLGHIKNSEALLHVVRCFEDKNVPFEYDAINPARDIETVDLELMAADTATLENKIARLEKKVRGGDKEAIRDSATCRKVYDTIQKGVPARRQELSAQERASVYDCNLASLKPVLYIANVKSMSESANGHVATLKEYARTENAGVILVCGKDEAEISQLDEADRPEFLRELGLTESSVERLLSAAYGMLGLINFFTVGEDEVRVWTCRRGDRAPVAAGKIHSDMEKGFIRMEVMRYEDLIELGSEAAVAKAGRQRLEGRDYEVKDGDIVTVRFNKG